MGIEELRAKFIVDDSVIKRNVEQLVEKALRHCLVDKHGKVHIKNQKLPSKVRVKLVIAARALAHNLDEKIPGDLNLEDIAECAGLPKNQARARIAEAADERFAEQTGRGTYRAVSHQIASFLDQLEVSGK